MYATIQIREDFESLLGDNVNPDTVVSQPDWVKSGGILIKPGAYFIIGTDGIYPMFGKVINILLILDNVILLVSHMKVEYFDSHYHAYVVSHSSDKSLISFHNLNFPSVLHGHKRNDLIFIYLKHYINVDF